MTEPLAPPPAPLSPSTRVHWSDGVRAYGDRLLAGGSPWRLVRLSQRSATLAHQWRDGGVVGRGHERFARTLVDQGLLTPQYERPEVGGVDVVVVSRDEERLGSLLASLVGLDVTVVDDASRDGAGVARVVAKSGAALVRLASPHGPAGARNEGLAVTSAQFVWFLDADVIVHDAAELLRRLLRHFGDARVGAVAPRVIGPNERGRRAHFERRAGPLDLGPYSGLVRPGGPVGYVPSACLLVRRSALGGGFDEELRVGEDVDLVWRLGDAGWLVRYDARLHVEHAARATLREWLTQRVGYGASAATLARRHGDRLAPLRMNAGALLIWALVLTGRPGPAVLAAQRLRARVADRLGADAATASALTARSLLVGFATSARALCRHFPYLVLGGLVVRPTRRMSLVVVLIGQWWRWRHRRPSPSDVALGVLDDAAYSAGLLRGALAERTIVHLLPRLRSTRASESP